MVHVRKVRHYTTDVHMIESVSGKRVVLTFCSGRMPRTFLSGLSVVCVCVYVRHVYVCIYMYMYICICVCVCVVLIQKHTHTNAQLLLSPSSGKECYSYSWFSQPAQLS